MNPKLLHHTNKKKLHRTTQQSIQAILKRHKYPQHAHHTRTTHSHSKITQHTHTHNAQTRSHAHGNFETFSFITLLKRKFSFIFSIGHHMFVVALPIRNVIVTNVKCTSKSLRYSIFTFRSPDDPITRYNMAKLSELNGNARAIDGDNLDANEIGYLRNLNAYTRTLANAYHAYGLGELNRKRFYLDRKLNNIDGSAGVQQSPMLPSASLQSSQKGVRVERPFFEQAMGQPSMKRAIDRLGGANLLKRAVDRLGGGHLLRRR